MTDDQTGSRSHHERAAKALSEAAHGRPRWRERISPHGRQERSAPPRGAVCGRAQLHDNRPRGRKRPGQFCDAVEGRLRNDAACPAQHERGLEMSKHLAARLRFTLEEGEPMLYCEIKEGKRYRPIAKRASGKKLDQP